MELDSIVIVSLHTPKEKILGRLLSLTAVGVTMQGIDLNAFDDWVRQALEAKPNAVTLSTIFYPMQRLERSALDEPSGEIPSLAQRFFGRVGVSLLDYLKLPRNSI